MAARRGVASRANLVVSAAPAAIGLGALLAYGLTLYPDVAGGDSGELVAAVASGGVIHPPGYPLYSLLGKLFVSLPIGNVAWRLNLMSGVCDAAAASLLYLAVARLSGSRPAGSIAAAAFAFSAVVWRYAVCAEVFPLNNLLNALLLVVAARYEARATLWVACLGALVVGLGLSNHHMFVLTAIPVAIYALLRGRDSLLRPRSAALLVLSFAFGLLPYLYLPVASRSLAPVSWGAAHTWAGFWTHVLRREYGTFQLVPSGVAQGASTVATVQAWARDLAQQLGWWGWPFLIVGVVACARRARRQPFFVSLLVAPTLSVAVIAILGNLPANVAPYEEILSRFWQQPDIFVFVLCGLGVAELGRRWWPALPAVLGGCAWLLLPATRFAAADRHKSLLVERYGSEILRAAPAGALLLTKGDLLTNVVRYMQVVRGQRPDVRVVDQSLLGFVWGRDRIVATHPEIAIPCARYMPGAPDGCTMKQILDANISRTKILLCGGIRPDDSSAEATYVRWPFGLCEMVRPATEPVNLDAWIRESEDALPQLNFTGQSRPKGSWEDVVWGDCWEVRQDRAAHLLRVAGPDPSLHRYIGVAADLLQGVVDENPMVPAHVYRNLAIALGRFGLDTPDERARAATAWKGYLERAPPRDPQRPAIEQEIERLGR